MEREPRISRAKRGRYLRPPRPSVVGIPWTERRLLVLLLALALDVELPRFAPEIRLALPLELVPVDRQGVVDGDLVLHELPHGGERQLPVLEFRVLERLVLLVRPAHGPDEPVPLLLDREGGGSLLIADLITALPCPDRIGRLVVRRVRQAACPEDQRHREDCLHDCLRDRGATEAVRR